MKKILVLLTLWCWIINPKIVVAKNPSVGFQGEVVEILEEKEIEVMEKKQWYQKLVVESLDKSQKVEIENGNDALANVVKYQVGDQVVVNTEEEAYIVDFVRSKALVWLVIIFVGLLIAVAGSRGAWSLLAMGVTFLVVFWFMLPRILAGDNPVVIAILSSLFIIPVTFYMSHGVNRKTTIAIIASVITLIIAAILGWIFIKLGYLTGLSSEEAGMLALDKSNLQMRGVLLAGMVIGALGVLDDITVSQSAIVEELATTAGLKKARDLYNRSMVVGKDHITSMVNTLVLAYAGAAMPLMLIFVNNPHPFGEIINYEMIAEEIIRTLVGSIALILAVPISSFIAANWKRES